MHREIISPRTFAIFGVALLAALIAYAVQSAPVIEHGAPKTSTTFMTCDAHGPRLIAVVVTYGDGSVIRYDVNNMAGLTAPELYMLAGSVKDQGEYDVGCGPTTDL